MAYYVIADEEIIVVASEKNDAMAFIDAMKLDGKSGTIEMKEIKNGKETEDTETS